MCIIAHAHPVVLMQAGHRLHLESVVEKCCSNLSFQNVLACKRCTWEPLQSIILLLF